MGEPAFLPSGLHKSQAGEGAQRSRQGWSGNSLKAGRRLSWMNIVPSLYYLLLAHKPQFCGAEIDFWGIFRNTLNKYYEFIKKSYKSNNIIFDPCNRFSKKQTSRKICLLLMYICSWNCSFKCTGKQQMYANICRMYSWLKVKNLLTTEILQ